MVALKLLVPCALAIAVALAIGPTGVHAQQVTFVASDAETVHGTWYRTEATANGLILAFHQGGASGEAEYDPIVPQLNREGFDVLAIDQRAGGGLFGGVNRTVQNRGGETGYCEAIPDLEGALAYVREQRPNQKVILWGSSYSGALVLRLAATRPDGVVAVLAFSPASGEPMTGCRGEAVSHRIDIPVLVLRPRSEMERESVAAQTQLFQEQGHQTFVADPGEHGSSMLVEDRVGAAVDATWNTVSAFLVAAIS